MAPSTVRATLKRFQAAGLSWPLPDELTDAALEARLFPEAGTKQGHRRQVEPDWASIHRELKRKHVTLSILWDEYIERDPDGLSLFALLRAVSGLGRQALGHDAPDPCRRRQAVRRLRRRHGAGDHRPADRRDPPGADLRRGAGRLELHLCRGDLDAGARPIGSAPTPARLQAIGGVPRLIVPDNTKVAVIKACLYEPQVNRTYAEMAAHYDTAVLPTRPRRPRDKAKVEAGVLIVERWLIGRLRNRRFYSLAELNAAIGELLAGSTRSGRSAGSASPAAQLLEELDRPALKPLPIEPYVFAEWRLRRVGIDYHVDVEGHFYSVPYRFARSEVEVRLTGAHRRDLRQGRADRRASALQRQRQAHHRAPTTCRRAIGATPTGPSSASAATPRSIGPATAALCDLILEQRPHPEQGFRSCLGIVRLARPFGAARLEAAATRAIEIGALTYGSVRSILDNKLDRHAAHQRAADGAPILHPNIRGSRYYH